MPSPLLTTRAHPNLIPTMFFHQLFRGKRSTKWMDSGMHPAEGVVKMLARRASRPEFAVLAASATLDRSTRRKLDKLLRNCERLGGLTSVPVVTAAAGGMQSSADGLAASGDAATGGADDDASCGNERVTIVPEGIEHRTLTLPLTSLDVRQPASSLRPHAPPACTPPSGLYSTLWPVLLPPACSAPPCMRRLVSMLRPGSSHLCVPFSVLLPAGMLTGLTSRSPDRDRASS